MILLPACVHYIRAAAPQFLEVLHLSDYAALPEVTLPENFGGMEVVNVSWPKGGVIRN